MRIQIPATMCLLLAACAGDPPEKRPAPERWRDIERQIVATFPGVTQVRTGPLAKELATDASSVLLIDVRKPEEFAVSRLVGARNVPEGAGLIEALSGVPPDRNIVVYCSVGYRSARAAQRLQRAGYSRVRNYLGSIFEWANEGRPLVNDRGATRAVHPFDAEWGQLLRPEVRSK